MSRRFLVVGSICVALGTAAAPSGATRYVLVDDGWGYDCYGSYANGASLVVPLSGGRPVVRGLRADLARTAQFVDDGRSVVWGDASGLRLADLHTGRSVVLARAAPESLVLGPGARTVLLVREGGRGAHLVLVRRRNGRVIRRVIQDADGVQAELSPDGRYVSYSGSAGIAVRSVAGGPARWVGTPTWSSIAGDRLAYLEGGDLHVRDLRTGAQTIDLPAPAGPAWEPPHASWSPDGRYIVLEGTVVADVRSGRIDPLPAFGTTDVAWRPGGGHQLLRTNDADSDLVDVAARTELWRRPGVPNMTWSPDGRWLLNSVDAALLSHDGRAARRWPRGFSDSVNWLGASMLVTADAQALRVAEPPTWRPRLLTRGAGGHHLTARMIFSASPAGLRLLARTFKAGAHARDCR